MRASNNPNGRPPKDGELRKAVSFRITPTASSAIKRAAELTGFSQSDLIEDYARMLQDRIANGWPIPDWMDRATRR